MRNITKIRRDFARLTKTSLAVAVLLLLSYLFLDQIVGSEIQKIITIGLIVLLVILWIWLFFLCREAILRFSRARRDFLYILETHDELLHLATDAQVMQNLAKSPDSILDILIKCLDKKRREAIIRTTKKRIDQLEELLGSSCLNDDLVQLEGRHELESLKHLIESLKRFN